MYSFEKISLKNLYKKYIHLDENRNIVNELDFFDTLIDGDIQLFIALKDKEVVGLITFNIDEVNNELEKLTLSTKKEHRNRGIAKKLIELQFNFAKINKLKIKQSKYSNMGTLYLKKYNYLYSQLLEIQME
jgi:ribosomal protein S18 acetylase RimI-like enzyme